MIDEVNTDLDVERGALPDPSGDQRTNGLEALASVAVPVPTGRTLPHRWRVLGEDWRRVAALFRTRSVSRLPGTASPSSDTANSPSTPTGCVIVLGTEFRQGDHALLLRGISQARRDGGRLVLVHHGAGGVSLLRAAAREFPDLATRTIALPASPSAAALRRAAELAEAVEFEADEVTVDDNGAVSTTEWRPAPLPPPRPAAPAPASVLITGGLGGLGLRTAAVLSSLGGWHPLLLDSTDPADLSAARLRLFDRLRRAPTGASVHTVDVLDAERVAEVSRNPHAPRVRAVVHCAGELRGCALDRATASELLASTRVKVDGLRHVLRALEPERIDHLVTFGSITAVQPHRGMAAYGLANELLTRETLRAAEGLPSCSTVAAQWSLFSGAGMAAGTAALEQARTMGMTPIPLRAGMRALLRLFGWPTGAAEAGSPMLLGARGDERAA